MLSSAELTSLSKSQPGVSRFRLQAGLRRSPLCERLCPQGGRDWRARVGLALGSGALLSPHQPCALVQIANPSASSSIKRRPLIPTVYLF